MFEGLTTKLRSDINKQHWSVTTLKVVITLWVIGVLILTWFFVNNPYVLTGILLYEVLP